MGDTILRMEIDLEWVINPEISLGTTLRQAAKARNIKVKELADAVPIDPSNVSHFLGDRRIPTPDQLRIICAHIGLHAGVIRKVYRLYEEKQDEPSRSNEMSVRDRLLVMFTSLVHSYEDEEFDMFTPIEIDKLISRIGTEIDRTSDMLLLKNKRKQAKFEDRVRRLGRYYQLD